MTRRARAWAGVLFALATVFGTSAASAPDACAETKNAAGLVVRTSKGAISQECVGIEAASDPIALLTAAGHRVETKDYGGALGSLLCAVDGDGPSAGACPGDAGHWHLWLWSAAGWVESQLGASSTVTRPGDIVGWTWEANDTAVAPPAPDNFALCDAGLTSAQSPASQERQSRQSGFAFLPVALVGVAASALVVIAIRRRGAER